MGHPEFEEMRKKRGGDAASPRAGWWLVPRYPQQLQGAVSAQSQGLKKSNRKNSFGQMRI